MTIETGGYLEWIAIPLRWACGFEDVLAEGTEHPFVYDSLGELMAKAPENRRQNIFQPGCVDTGCMDSIHAAANELYTLLDNGFVYKCCVEAFDRSLRGQGLTCYVDLDADEDRLDIFWVHASIDNGYGISDLSDDARLDMAFPATREGYREARMFQHEYGCTVMEANPAIRLSERTSGHAALAAASLDDGGAE